MAEKLYGYCGSKCKHEVYSKTEIDKKLNGKIVVLSGTINCTTTSGYTSTTVSYPSGFTKNNCVVISFGSGGQSYKAGYAGLAFGYVHSPQDGYLNGAEFRNVLFKDNEISISFYNPNSSAVTFDYKVVLMRID